MTETLNWTTDPVDLPGVDPADPPRELVAGRLWQGGCPVDFSWVRETGIDVVVDGGELPAPALTLRLASLVAGLVEDGHRALVHCTFGRNRSGLLTTLVVRELLGLSGAEALALVRERRDRAVNNETFAAWLRSLPAPTGASSSR